jgi:hypothetical protein
MIGKIKHVPLREVWKHEALDFTKWLEENLDVLSDKIGITLMNVEREKSAGEFNVDLVAEDESGNPVIIENQLAKSDHDHLGKIITYLTAIEAKAAIWIVSEPRPEHIAAISWLNESSAASFYLLKVQAIQIDESKPAPLLTLIVGPSVEARHIGERKKEMSEREGIRKEFWSQFLAYSRTQTKLHATISPTHHNWIGTGAGISGLGYNYSITQHEAYIELYIDRGKDMDEENLRIFRQLLEHRTEIENKFGEPLDWQELENRRACRIRKTIEGGYRDPESKWPEIHRKMVDIMVRLEKALSPHIKKLDVGT